MSPRILLFLSLIFPPFLAWAQESQVEGRIIDKNRGVSLAGTHVRLTSQNDTTRKYIATTDTTGSFQFSDITSDSYTLEATRVGYKALRKTVNITGTHTHLGTLMMTESTIPLREFIVEGRVPPAVQKGDTTEYNARAFKTNPDATAEDLVTKMPGVVVQNGTVQAQGENVQQVLVDGRQFFGSDPTLALRNLPSDVIDKVQVFDKLSDQAQLTGFDDGQTIKTMNIVTRPERRTGEFGRLYGGYGTNNRYLASGNLNLFRTDQRISLIGLSNNVNQQNFATQDLFGVMGNGNQMGGSGGGGVFGRGRRSGGGRGSGANPTAGMGGNAGSLLISQQSGLSTAHSLGFNDADSITSNLFASGSYFFNLTDNQNPKTTHRQYVYSKDSTSLYDENSDADRTNYNHRFNVRLEYTADSSNSFIATPQFYIQDNKSTSSVRGINSTGNDALLSRTQNGNQTTTDGYTTQTNLVFRHKFPTQGRTLSISFGVRGSRKNGTTGLNSLDNYYTSQAASADTLSQQTGALTDGYTLSSNAMYTEPIGSNGLVQINYTPSYSRNTSDSKTYNFDSLTNSYSVLNQGLSNTFDNTYLTNSAGVGYRFRAQSLNATAGVSYQAASLQGEQTFPQSLSVKKVFFSVLPSAMINYELTGHRGLRLLYRTSTTSPSITQLQNVVNNSNPLLLSGGNPDLRQSYSHTLLSRLSLTSEDRAQSTLLFFFATYTKDYIGNTTLVALRDSLLPGGIRLSQGSQLTAPVNLDGYWNVRSLCTYGFPVDFLESNLNLNGSITYTRTPGLINGDLNTANVYTLSPGFVLGSNISENLDFTLSYTANFNTSRNTTQAQLDNTYFNHTAGFKFNWIFWQGFDIKSDFSNILYNDQTGTLNQNYALWNLSIGKKIFSNQRGEILVSVYDLLNQNRSVNRTVTETYVEDATTAVLNRYYMLTFSYNVRQFSEPRPDFPRPRPED